VLVVGAGAAGLAAARDLSQAGLRVTIIEARDRIGGRILTVHDARAPVPIELGAEFIHNEGPETLAIARAAQLMVVELPDEHLLASGGKFRPLDSFWDTVDAMSRDLARRTRRGRDFAVSEYLENARLPRERRVMLRDFIEGYHAAHPERMSAMGLASDLSGDGDPTDNKQLRIANGGDGIVQWLRNGLDPERTELRLSTIAQELQWSRGQVRLRCHTADTALLELEARSVVIALPHAVLRAGALRIEPVITAKQRALEQLEPGQVFKIVLRFREAFWNEPDFVSSRMKRGSRSDASLNFVHSQGADLPTWWTTLPARTALWTGWVGGPRAEAILAESEQARLERSLATLAQVLSVPRRKLDDLLDGWMSHDWRADPSSRAAYTYIGVGGSGAPAALARPVDGTLFFAGEATNGEQIGTVAGALASGRRAAKEVIRALRRR